MSLLRALGFVLLVIVPASPVQAAIRNALSCSLSDVQTQVTAAAATGDTITVPAGTCTWSGGISTTKTIVLQGAGAGSTVINSGTLFFTNAGAFRVTGFTFDMGSSASTMITVERSVGWRIDHNTVTRTTVGNMILTYAVGANVSEGLIDNNNLTNSKIVHFGEDTSSGGRFIWSSPLQLGTSHAIYIEDNTMTYTNPSGQGLPNTVDGNLGCRYVARFNTIHSGRFEVHSLQSLNSRACMLWEIYNNTLDNPLGSNKNYRPWLIRGGTGLVFHNTTDGNFTTNLLYLDNVRTYEVSVGIWNFCDGTIFIDGNTGGGEGYPCRDQIGRTTDASLWDYSNPAPTQAAQPAYLWRNTQPPGTTEIATTLNCTGTAAQCTRQSTLHILENRDYYLYNAAFNGTTGVGEGTLAARPATCTIGVGYWATDQGDWNARVPGNDGQLYTCTSTNTWSLTYTPYTYPHPLQGFVYSPTTVGKPQPRHRR